MKISVFSTMTHDFSTAPVKSCDASMVNQHTCCEHKHDEVGQQEDIRTDKGNKVPSQTGNEGDGPRRLSYVTLIINSPQPQTLPPFHPPSSGHRTFTFGKIHECEMRSVIALLRENHLRWLPDHTWTHSQYGHFSLTLAVSLWDTHTCCWKVAMTTLTFSVGQSEDMRKV